MKQITNRELKILEYLDFLEDWRDTNRSFIGIEMDDKYFEIAKQRIL